MALQVCGLFPSGFAQTMPRNGAEEMQNRPSQLYPDVQAFQNFDDNSVGGCFSMRETILSQHDFAGILDETHGVRSIKQAYCASTITPVQECRALARFPHTAWL
ncbi:MAG: hypothetical protein U5L46_15835 [Agrobacterium sp.]|nr:hypothetical protein [Agrobacterium sp.]